MESNPLITASSSTIVGSLSYRPPIDAQRAAFKAYLIQKYCEDRADEPIVAAAFELFPELAEA